MTYSIIGDWKAAMLACLVEKPPVETAAIEWHVASKKSIPDSWSESIPNKVKQT